MPQVAFYLALLLLGIIAGLSLRQVFSKKTEPETAPSLPEKEEARVMPMYPQKQDAKVIPMYPQPRRKVAAVESGEEKRARLYTQHVAELDGKEVDKLEARRAYGREWHHKNREKRIAQMREYRKKKKMKQYQKEYWAKNKEQLLEKRNKRKGKEEPAPADFTSMVAISAAQNTLLFGKEDKLLKAAQELVQKART